MDRDPGIPGFGIPGLQSLGTGEGSCPLPPASTAQALTADRAIRAPYRPISTHGRNNYLDMCKLKLSCRR